MLCDLSFVGLGGCGRERERSRERERERERVKEGYFTSSASVLHDADHDGA